MPYDLDNYVVKFPPFLWGVMQIAGKGEEWMTILADEILFDNHL